MSQHGDDQVPPIPPEGNNQINPPDAAELQRIRDRLALYDKNLTTKTNLPTQYTQHFELKKYEVSSQLDLRGHRVEDALCELEGYLDEASLANLTPVYIIHGHGTGALKSAVRDFLTTSPYVAKFRPGQGAEGGDGVSVVDIK